MMKWIWIENSDGKKDTMLTFSVVAMTVVLIRVLFGTLEIKLGPITYNVGVIDPSTITSLLTPTLGAYVIRRYTDKKFDAGSDDPVAPVEKKV